MNATPPQASARERLEQVHAEVIRSALEVHRFFGPGLEPALYQRAIERELAERGLRWRRGVAAELTYKGLRVGTSRISLLAEGLIIAIRVVPALTQGDVGLVAAQARSLDAAGVLLNFGAERLELRRVRRSHP